MKRTMTLIVLALAAASLAGAQARTTASSMEGASSARYSVWSDAGKADATALVGTMDGLFAVYNEYFRFDDSLLKAPLTVRKFATKAAFDAYLNQAIGQAKDDFVYLHYPTAERSELVIFAKDPAEDFNASLAHQAFVQFLKAFVPEPPLWIREGFAVFFEKTARDTTTGKVAYQENLSWLETVKLLMSQKKLFRMEDMMLLSPEEARNTLDIFYPQSWAMVSFFLNSADRRYNRYLWEALKLLRPEASLEQNQVTLQTFFRRWHGSQAASDDFLSFLDSQKTFAELVTAGVKAYNDKDLDAAARLFHQALSKNKGSYIPHYYLGLIAYAKNDYSLAEQYYSVALELGSEAPITNYALGINAFASKRYEDAKTFLERAATGDTARYGAKTKEILDRIPATSGM